MASALERDVTIDKFHLDDEAQNLPSIIGKYHEKVYKRTQELSQLELDLEREEAVARKNVRDEFLLKGTKFTVDMVNDGVALTEAVHQLRLEVADARAEVAYLKGVLSALDAKKLSLNNLVSLYCKAYYDNEKAKNGDYREADILHTETLGDNGRVKTTRR